MITPAHYPYSTTYLATHMERMSRGIVVGGLAIICWLIIAVGIYGAYTFIASFF